MVLFRIGDSMGKRLIQPVSDNKDKQRTYAENMSKYKKAITGEFFFEAILIDYAMLEDRLRSFLYHIGLLKSRDSYKADNAIVISTIRPIIAEYKGKDESDSVGITNISGKIKIVRCTLLWAANTEGISEDPYLTTLKSQYEVTLDIGDVLDKLNAIVKWCAYRNEVIHALLNKNTGSLMQDLPQQARRGMELARFMDDQVKKLKKGNVIRRRLRLPLQS